MLCLYPDCVKNIQEVNERLCSSGYSLKCIVPRLFEKYTRCEWACLHSSGYVLEYTDCVRNIHVNGRGYTLPDSLWNALHHCFQLVSGIFTLAIDALLQFIVRIGMKLWCYRCWFRCTLWMMLLSVCCKSLTFYDSTYIVSTVSWLFYTGSLLLVRNWQYKKRRTSETSVNSLELL